MNPPLNREVLHEQVGDEPELLLSVVEMFLQDSRDILIKLLDGLTRHDAEEIQRDAHRLKGALLTIGAQPAADAAFVLESMGRTGDLSNAGSKLEQLRAELARLEPELDAVRQGASA